MKGKVKGVAIFLVLIMVFNIFAPTMKVFAEGKGYIAKVSLNNGSVSGSDVTYKVDGVDVVLKLADGITVDNKPIEVAVDSESGKIDGITLHDNGF